MKSHKNWHELVCWSTHGCEFAQFKVAKENQVDYFGIIQNSFDLSNIETTLISLINVEVRINVEGGIFWKKQVHKCNKRGGKGWKNLRNQ